MGRWVHRSCGSGATNRSSAEWRGDRPGSSSRRCASSTSQNSAQGNAATQGSGKWSNGAKGGGVNGDHHGDGVGGDGGVVVIALIGSNR